MTVIVGASTDSTVFMACDSMTTNAGSIKHLDTRAKMWTADQYLIGAAGDVSTAQAIRHHITWPKFRKDEDTDAEAFVVKSILPAIRRALADGCIVKNEPPWRMDGELLVAWANNLLSISADGAVLQSVDGVLAIGSGRYEALGVMKSSMGGNHRDAVISAARAAASSDTHCGGPILIADTRSLVIAEAD